MSLQDKQWRPVCSIDDLIANSGVCVLINEDTEHEQQIALFNVQDDKLFAISNYDPFGKANVLYRGIVGTLNQKFVVASPLYKQHFDLESGQCVEDETVGITTFNARFNDKSVELFC